jgi:uncharacterized protein YeaO (DUF488 family)
MIATQRVYEDNPHQQARRFLVERLWPRGLRKDGLKIDAWLKDVAPSTALRQWFNHDPVKWSDFRRRYFAELDRAPQAWQPLADAARRGDVLLLYSSRDTEHNNAAALKEYLDERLHAREGAGRRTAVSLAREG